MEIWKDINGYEGLYQVSNEGRVKSFYRNKILNLKGHPYVQLTLCKNGKKEYPLLHRIIWETFNGDIPEGIQVNHHDENKENNALWNLELMTPEANINYGNRNKKVSEKMKGIKPSIKAIQKSKDLFSQKVYQYNLDGELVGVYPSMMEAERETKTRSGNISKCCNGKSKTANGYKWSFNPL